ncbi:type VI secretion system ATPase TssH [Sulfurimonas lithotrophica]|uniref:Chaperone protein ClpB n=1 Tax=Sulfurimonas lithotrophica TaxID=2590022 RepID=A0A5P8NZQ2_9BACT|nr:type VI secretion system ATPase TssH [Sulfurimonas lithotrophica]QFR48936.1 type VI secretion system ATPase TssH [Sulfurimonas lithotrophica]
MKFEIRELINALDEKTKLHLQNAATRCMERSGNEILIEDLLFVMCEDETSLFNAVMSHYKIDVDNMIEVLQHSVKVDTTESSSPVFSKQIISLLENAFFIAKMQLNVMEISDAAILISLFENGMKYMNTGYFQLLQNIPLEELKQLIEGLNEEAVKSVKLEKNLNTKKHKSSAELEKYTTNLTKLAKSGEIDPVLCRDDEIKQAIDILLRRRKNNPIMVGEAGVGKTAVVEGLALKIINQEVPTQLYDAQILSLDLGSLQAGAGVKGEFERRLQAVINEIQHSSDFIILFIDEAHTLIGAGGNEGSGDAANLLKPALARGQLRTIAATTWLEYRKYFEKDPALSRRFQKIDLLEPTVDQSVTILRGLAKKYEEVHEVYIEDEALQVAASLSARYITGRQLPDKAIDVLDTACANVKISQTNTPFIVQKMYTDIEELKRKQEFFVRDNNRGIKDYRTQIFTIEEQLKDLEKEVEIIIKSWKQQRSAMDELKQAIANDETEKIKQLHKKIDKLHEKNRYIHKHVTKEQIAEVISSWTGIPLGNMVNKQIEKVMDLAKFMKQRIIGQDEAIDYINQFLQISMAGLKKENAPAGVFLLVGPSGVGKTETALSIADLVFGGERFITTINMTEFQEKHTVSRLIGSPPGYVGYGDGGQLTDPVRIKPYSVVLLDEIEKAHPDVLNLFYQMFDKGVLNDGEGRTIDFKNTIIVMTSNLATFEITELCTQNQHIQMDEIKDYITPILSNYLQPALLGRMNVIPYFNLKDDALKDITKLKLNFINTQLEKKDINFKYDESLLNYIVELSNARDTGARNIELIINSKIMPELSKVLLSAAIEKKELKELYLGIDENRKIMIRS